MAPLSEPVDPLPPRIGLIRTAEFLRVAIDAALHLRALEASHQHGKPSNFRGYQCSEETCSRPAYAKGMCNGHYIRAKAGKDMVKPLRARSADGVCAVCGDPKNARGGWGLCAKHFRQERGRVVKEALVQALGGACSACAGVFPLSAYDFHHRVAGDKLGSPSLLIQNWSVARLAEELSGCDLLCANCHRIEHTGDSHAD